MITAMKKHLASVIGLTVLTMTLLTGCSLSLPEIPSFTDEAPTQVQYSGYDIKATSDAGISSAAIDDVAASSLVRYAEGRYVRTVPLRIEDDTLDIQIASLTRHVNVPALCHGRLPDTAAEIILEVSLQEKWNLTEGDCVVFDSDAYLTDSFTVVGFYEAASADTEILGILTADAFCGDGFDELLVIAMPDSVEQARSVLETIGTTASDARYTAQCNTFSEMIDEENARITLYEDYIGTALQDTEDELNEAREAAEAAAAYYAAQGAGGAYTADDSALIEAEDAFLTRKQEYDDEIAEMQAAIDDYSARRDALTDKAWTLETGKSTPISGDEK